MKLGLVPKEKQKNDFAYALLKICANVLLADTAHIL
jgi:hypothetical protein